MQEMSDDAGIHQNGTAAPHREHDREHDRTGIQGKGPVANMVRLMESAGLLVVFAAVIVVSFLGVNYFYRQDMRDQHKAQIDVMLTQHERQTKILLDASQLDREDRVKQWAIIGDHTRATILATEAMQTAARDVRKLTAEVQKLIDAKMMP